MPTSNCHVISVTVPFQPLCTYALPFKIIENETKTIVRTENILSVLGAKMPFSNFILISVYKDLFRAGYDIRMENFGFSGRGIQHASRDVRFLRLPFFIVFLFCFLV